MANSDFATSTPLNSPKLSSEEMKNALQDVIEMIERCIQNGISFLSSLEKETSPDMKRLNDLFQRNAQSMIQLRDKLKQLSEAVKSGNQNEIMENLRVMMSSIEKMSIDKLEKFADVVCMTETSQVRKKFEETDKELKNIRNNAPDDKTRKLADILDNRNQTIIKCLQHASRVLQKFYDGSKSSDETSRKQKKLIILGQSLEKHLPVDREHEFLANIVIEEISAEKTRKRSSLPASTQVTRVLLNGYIIDENEQIQEVFLERNQLIDSDVSFSASSVDEKINLTARFESTNESMPVEEIEYFESEEAPKVIAIIANQKTGLQQSIEMALVPTAAENQVHGKILGLKTALTETPKSTRQHTTTQAHKYNIPLKRQESLTTLKHPKRTARDRYKDVLRMVSAIDAMAKHAAR